MQNDAAQTKRAALEKAGFSPEPLTAYERVAFARVAAANENGERRKAVRHVG